MTIDNQREEISRLRMRNSELCVVEEDADFQERQYKELRMMYDNISEELTEVTQQLSKAVNENVQLRSRIDIETEQNEIDRDTLVEQCDKVLRQNSALLQKLSDVENELGRKVLPSDNSGGVSGTKKMSTAAVGEFQGVVTNNSSTVAQLEAKVTKLTEKLKASDLQVFSPFMIDACVCIISLSDLFYMYYTIDIDISSRSRHCK